MLAFHMICLYVLRILSCPSMNHSTVPLWLSFEGTTDMLPNSLSLLKELSNCIPYISFSFLLQPSKFKLFVSCRFPFFQIYSVIDFFFHGLAFSFFFLFRQSLWWRPRCLSLPNFSLAHPIQNIAEGEIFTFSREAIFIWNYAGMSYHSIRPCRPEIQFSSDKVLFKIRFFILKLCCFT
jgi:hypothetical protein